MKENEIISKLNCGVGSANPKKIFYRGASRLFLKYGSQSDEGGVDQRRILRGPGGRLNPLHDPLLYIQWKLNNLVSLDAMKMK